ncbi:MAG: hypothetical protein K0S35_2838, partial [Geminicoccaceae bacterium]|nr:hypothetical protein [Geminicoccaceae bacterium]
HALVATRQIDLLRDTWEEARERGTAWRKALDDGRARLDPKGAQALAEAIAA